MSSETDRILNPHARRFHGFEGGAPIHLGDDLHIDRHDGGRYFVADNPTGGQFRIYASRAELIEAARSILRHFGEA